MRKEDHLYPYASLFKRYVSDLGQPDQNGWATGSCPYCGEPGTFRANLKSGRWTCLPTPPPRVTQASLKRVGRRLMAWPEDQAGSVN